MNISITWKYLPPEERKQLERHKHGNEKPPLHCYMASPCSERANTWQDFVRWPRTALEQLSAVSSWGFVGGNLPVVLPWCQRWLQRVSSGSAIYLVMH